MTRNLKKSFSKIKVKAKYFANDINYRVLATNLDRPLPVLEDSDILAQAKNIFRKKKGANGLKGGDDILGLELKRFMEQINIGLEVLKLWNQKDEKGNFTELAKRSEFNLTAEDIERQVDPFYCR